VHAGRPGKAIAHLRADDLNLAVAPSTAPIRPEWSGSVVGKRSKSSRSLLGSICPSSSGSPGCRPNLGAGVRSGSVRSPHQKWRFVGGALRRKAKFDVEAAAGPVEGAGSWCIGRRSPRTGAKAGGCKAWRQSSTAVCKDTDSRKLRWISLAPEPYRACPGRFRPSDGRHKAGLGPPADFHAQPFTEAGNRYGFPRNKCPIRSPSDNPSLIVGFATLCPSRHASAS